MAAGNICAPNLEPFLARFPGHTAVSVTLSITANINFHPLSFIPLPVTLSTRLPTISMKPWGKNRFNRVTCIITNYLNDFTILWAFFHYLLDLLFNLEPTKRS